MRHRTLVLARAERRVPYFPPVTSAQKSVGFSSPGVHAWDRETRARLKFVTPGFPGVNAWAKEKRQFTRPLRKLYFGRSLACVAFGWMILLIGSLSTCSAEPADKALAGDYAGVVTNPDGTPAAGCQVWLIRRGRLSSLDTSVAEETVTDANGRFAFRTPRPDPLDREAGYFAPLARDSQGRTSWSLPATPPPRIPPSPDSTVAKPEPPKPYQLKLVETRDFHGRLLETTGQPIAKATIEPVYVSGAEFGKPIYSLFSLPPGLKEFSGETDADGAFVLREMPLQGTISARITAAGFGTPIASWGLGKPVTIKLERPGSVSGSFVCAEQPSAAAGIKLRLLPPSSLRRAEPDDAEFHVSYPGRELTQPDGRFRFEGVVPRTYALDLERDDTFAYYPELPAPFEVKSGQAVTGITVPLRRAIAVKGKVVDQQSGEGIKDVDVYLYLREPSDQAQPSWTRFAKTDEQGGFVAYVKPGKFTVSISRVPETYLRPSYRTPSPTFEVTKDTELPPIQLERAQGIVGVVVDEAGNPVAGAEVLLSSDDFANFDPRKRIKSDQEGKFSLTGISTKQRLGLRARTDAAVTDGPVMVEPAQGPIRLVVSAKHVVTFSGTVVDDAGRPIQDATLNLYTLWRTGSGGIGFTLDTAKAGDQGRFAFRGLWPGDEYQVKVESPGFEKSETPRVRGEPGKTHDFAKIVLASAQGVVEGTVIDSAGKPVVDVRVFNTGDAPQTVSTKTDAAGHFRLEGLKPGPVYVFVEKAHHRFSGVRTAAGATDVVIKLLRKDEPVRPRPAPPHAVPAEEQQKLARKLLEKLWAEVDHGKLGSAVTAMGRLDPEQALKWAAEMGGPYAASYAASVRAMMAEKIANQDLEEAFSLLAQNEKGGSVYTYKKLAERFASSAAAKAMRCAEEMAVRGRAAEQPLRTRYLAEAGALVIRLGNKEAGMNLIEEAAKMVETLGSGQSQDFLRAQVAGALALYDFARAHRLTDSISDKSAQNGARENMALAVCREDPEQALQILGKMEYFYADRAKVKIACRLARTRPADAVRVIETIGAGSRSPSSSSLDQKVLALGWVAAAVAPRDKPLACSLIDQGLAMLLAPTERVPYSSSYGGRAAKAAFLAALANEIGYADMESVIFRVLACRATTKNEYSPTRVLESNLIVAGFLALVDPQVARDILQSIEPQSEAIGSGMSGVGRDAWLRTWLLVDPKRGEVLFDRELTEMKSKSGTESRFYTLVAAAPLLTAPLADKLLYIGRSSDFRRPDMGAEEE